MRFNLTVSDEIGTIIKKKAFEQNMKENDLIREVIQIHYSSDCAKFKLIPNEFKEIKMKSLEGFFTILPEIGPEKSVMICLSKIYMMPDEMHLKMDDKIICDKKILDLLEYNKFDYQTKFKNFKSKHFTQIYALIVDEDKILIILNLSLLANTYLNDIITNAETTMIISKEELNTFFEPV